MTDEEKAEEYARNEICIKLCPVWKASEGRCNRITKCHHTYARYNGYLDGLAEGERIGKEKQWKATEKAQKRTSARIRELKKENKEQKEQIEKMKNVGNCRHTMQCPDWVEHKIKDDGIKPCINCDKWELDDATN